MIRRMRRECLRAEWQATIHMIVEELEVFNMRCKPHLVSSNPKGYSRSAPDVQEGPNECQDIRRGPSSLGLLSAEVPEGC